MNEGVKKGLQQLMADAGVTDEDATALLSHFEGAVDRVNTHAQQPGVIARSTATVPVTAVADEGAEKSNDEGEIVVDESVIAAIVAQLERSGRLVPPAAAEATMELPDVDAIVARVSEGLDARFGELAQQINDNFTALSERVEAVEDALDLEAERLEDLPETTRRTVVYRPSNPDPEGEEPTRSEPAGLEKLPAY